MSRHTIRALAGLGLVAAILAGCGTGASTPSSQGSSAGPAAASSGDPSTAQQAPPQDKAGTQTLTLRIATPDVVNNNGMSYGTQAFVDDLATVSGGLLKVDVLDNYGDGSADSENQIIKALQAGEIDGGWPAARSFASAGIPALEALEAPMTVTNVAAERALVTGPTAADALAALKGTGLVGLSLLIGPLRRPFAAQAPLLEPKDWRGATFRTFNSPLQSATITALGGTPVIAGSDWTDQITAGTLRAVEFDVAQYDVNGDSTEAPFVTANEVLWPKVFVLALSQKRWDSLGGQQRAWIQEAADMAREASVSGSYDESAHAQHLCGLGVRFVDASDDQLAAMHAALAPVIAKLASDPATAALMKDVQAAAAQHPGIDEPVVPDSCRTVRLAPVPSIPTTVAALPDGTYRQRVTEADAQAADLEVSQGYPGTWTLVVKQGTFKLSCRFIGDPQHDCGNSHYDGGVVEAGRLFGSGQKVFFVGDAQMQHDASGCLLPASHEEFHCYVVVPYWFTWSLAGDQLTFSDPGGFPADATGYSFRPWTKIG